MRTNFGQQQDCFFLKSNLKFIRGTPWINILKNWLFLATSIIFEVIATSALKSSEGFTRLVPSFIVVAGYAAAFYFLSLTLKSIPVGIAYAVWSGLDRLGHCDCMGFAWSKTRYVGICWCRLHYQRRCCAQLAI